MDAVLAICKPNQEVDLHMVEVMEMKHKTDTDTQYVLCVCARACVRACVQVCVVCVLCCVVCELLLVSVCLSVCLSVCVCFCACFALHGCPLLSAGL